MAELMRSGRGVPFDCSAVVVDGDTARPAHVRLPSVRVVGVDWSRAGVTVWTLAADVDAPAARGAA